MTIKTVTYYRAVCDWPKCGWEAATVWASRGRAEERLARHTQQHERRKTRIPAVIRFPRRLYYPASVGSFAGTTKYHLSEDCGALSASGSEYEEHSSPPSVEEQCRRCWPLGTRILEGGK